MNHSIYIDIEEEFEIEGDVEYRSGRVRVGNVRVTFRGINVTEAFSADEIARFAEKLGEAFLKEQLEHAV